MNNNYIYFDENGVLYELSGTTGLPLLKKILPPYVSYTLESPTFSTPEDPTYYIIMVSSSDYWATGRTLSYMSGYTYLFFERPLDNDDMFKVILSGSSTSFKIVLNGDKELGFNGYHKAEGLDIGNGASFSLTHTGSQTIDDPYSIQIGGSYLFQASTYGHTCDLGGPSATDPYLFYFFKVN